MAFPTLTWTNTAERTITAAGANPTVSEILVAIKAAIDNDSTLWMTSDYSLANGTLEIKRKGSPTGEQATVRILFFGGQVPNAAACTIPAPTLNNTTLYCGMSVDAATTGPAASYAVGAPYSTKYIKANTVCTGTNLITTNGPKISLIESVDCLAVCVHDNTVSATAICGYIIEDVANNVLHWACWTSAGSFTGTTTDSTFNGLGATGVLLTPFGSGLQHATYWNSVAAACRSSERLNGFISGATGNISAGASGGAAAFMPVFVSDHANVSVSVFPFFGFLRQIRLGPMATHLSTFRNAGGVVQAIHFGPPVGQTVYGAWFDQVA